MIYLAPQANVLRNADPTRWGLICTPRRRSKDIPLPFKFLADNDCFSGTWEEDGWLRWLDGLLLHQDRCIMVTLPDVVGDAIATLSRFYHYLPIIRARGWPVGLVGQDGLESLPWPQDYDALFIGGSTEWKLSDAADWCIAKAKKAGKWTHVGRVNGGKRIRHFKLVGVDSVDGTGICFNPTEEFRKIRNGLAYQPLFTLD